MNVQHNATTVRAHYTCNRFTNWVSLSQYHMRLWDKHDMRNTTGNALTARKVSEEVFQANPRTKSFLWTGSALATPLISSAIEGYWEPLYNTQSNTICRESITATQFPQGTPIVLHTKHSHMQNGVQDSNSRTHYSKINRKGVNFGKFTEINENPIQTIQKLKCLTHSLARRSTSWDLARGSSKERRCASEFVEISSSLPEASSSFLFFTSSIFTLLLFSLCIAATEPLGAPAVCTCKIRRLVLKNNIITE